MSFDDRYEVDSSDGCDERSDILKKLAEIKRDVAAMKHSVKQRLDQLNKLEIKVNAVITAVENQD